MPWPFVLRRVHDETRRQLRQAKALASELRQRTVAAEAAADVLRHQLDKSEIERSDINLKLLRVGFGINPFAELTQTSVLPEAPAPEEPAPAFLAPTASPDEVRASFVREGFEMYGNDLRKLQRHVERRQTEYYAHRPTPEIVSAAELSLAAQVAADLERDIAEGIAAAAAKE